MLLLATDPHLHHLDLAVFINGRLVDIVKARQEILSNCAQALTITREPERKVFIIESQYVNRKKKFIPGEDILKLAQAAGKAYGVMEYLGWECHWVLPADWMKAMISDRGRIPESKRVDKLALMVARNSCPGFTVKNGHEAAAVCMGLHMLAKERMRGK